MSKIARTFAACALSALAIAACSGGGSGEPGADATDTTHGADGDVSESSPNDAADVDSSDGDDASDIGADSEVVDGDVSKPDGADTDADGGCRVDRECPGNAVCEENECRAYVVVQIRDVTRSRSSSFEEACEDDASGADLFELELQGPFGTARGYADVLKTNLTSSANTDAETVFDGSSNSLKQSGEALCPTGGFDSDSVLSLGCGGTMLVVFRGGDDEILFLGDGQQLVVHEYGEQCCEGGCPDEYWEVRVCSADSLEMFQDAEPDVNGIFPTCSTDVLGLDTAKGTATIELPRP